MTIAGTHGNACGRPVKGARGSGPPKNSEQRRGKRAPPPTSTGDQESDRKDAVSMPRHTNSDESATDSTATDDQLAAQLGTDISDDAPDTEALQELIGQLEEETSPPVSSVLEGLVAMINQLQDRVEELEAQQEQTHDIATTAVGKSAEAESRLDDIEEQQEETHEVAKSAIAKAQQLEADPDQQEDAETLPEGTEPSSSPLDFFANCRQAKVKTMFVERSNRQNTYRAISIAKRWPEFATERTDGSGVFFTKDDVETALTAELGKNRTARWSSVSGRS